MSIFSNAETSVEPVSVIKGKYNPDTATESVLGTQYFARREEEKQKALLEAEAKQQEEHEKRQRLEQMVVNAALFETKLQHKLQSVKTETENTLFKDILFEFFYGGLKNIDEYFLEENKNILKGITDKYIDDNGGYNLLKESVIKTKSVLLERMQKGIDKITREVCSRKCEDSSNCAVTGDSIDFNLNEDEQEDLDYLKKDLNIEEISALVKDKVLTVVQDEKARKEEEDSLMQSIEDDLMEDESIEDEQSMNEALQRIIIKQNPIEETTLFDALFRNSYHDYLLENVTLATATQQQLADNYERNSDYDTEMDTTDATENDLDSHSVQDVQNEGINMDIIFTEALTKYTLMETLYTLKLEDYPRENMRHLVNKLINVK